MKRLGALRPRSAVEYQAAMRLGAQPVLPCSSNARWLLLCLYRHIPRQAWVGEVVGERLGGDLNEIGRFGGFGHPEDVADDRVPGLPAWSFRFHGIGCCLTHDDGTCLDVDFRNGRADRIDPYFFQLFLESLPKPDEPERRLRRADPLCEYWMHDLTELRVEGLVEGDHDVRLTDAGHALGAGLEAVWRQVEAELNPWSRAWLAQIIDDAALAMAQLDATEVPANLERRVAQCRKQRINALTLALERGATNKSACLKALACHGREVAGPKVVAILETAPVDHIVVTALDILADWGAADDLPILLRLLKRVEGNEVPAPAVRMRAAAQIMRLVVDGRIHNVHVPKIGWRQ